MENLRQPLKVLVIGFITAIGLNIVFYWFVIRQKKTVVNHKESEYFELRDNLFGARKRIKNEKYFKDNFSKTESDLQKFDLILPRYEEITRLIRELPNIAEKTGVKVSGVKYQLIKDEGYNRLSFSLPVEGSYSEIRRFIYEIETMRKVIWIERLAIKTSYSMREELSIQLTMSTYFL
ncbi:MAG: type 4a pilus biogenesis protein PilO [bacterium]